MFAFTVGISYVNVAHLKSFYLPFSSYPPRALGLLDPFLLAKDLAPCFLQLDILLSNTKKGNIFLFFTLFVCCVCMFVKRAEKITKKKVFLK